MRQGMNEKSFVEIWSNSSVLVSYVMSDSKNLLSLTGLELETET